MNTFEMANIRDQCSWVHMHEKAEATEKAKALVRMAVMNANNIKPLKDIMLDVNKKSPCSWWRHGRYDGSS